MPNRKTKVCLRCGKRKKIKTGFYSRNCNRYRESVRTWCKKCEIKLASEWNKTEKGKESQRRSHKNRLKLYPGKEAKRQREYRKQNARKFRDYELKSHYGITLLEWEEIFKKQGKKCKICKAKKPNTKRRWFTDHDHKTKKFRGILCGHCNSILGYAKDSEEILKAAIAYLKKHKNEAE